MKRLLIIVLCLQYNIVFAEQGQNINTNLEPPISDNCVMALTFNDGAGSSAADISGYGNNASLNGTDWIEGFIDKGVNFDGTDYATVSDADSISFDWDSKFSVVAFLRDCDIERTIIAKVNASNQGWFFYTTNYTGNGTIALIMANTYSSKAYFIYSNAGTPLWKTDHKWHAVGFTYSGNSNAELYIDGIKYPHSLIWNTLGSNTIEFGDDIFIASRYTGYPYPFAGDVDNIYIYNVNLSEAEMFQIANRRYMLQ